MKARGVLVFGLLAIVGFGAAWAVDSGVKGRIAGDGPEAKYYLGKDVDAGTLINHLHTLQHYKAQGEPTAPLGYHLSDVDAAIKKVQSGVDALLKKGRIIEVVYNLPVTTTEKDQTVTYSMFPDEKIPFGRGYTATVVRVRIDDGQLKGREYYARRLVDRTHVVVTDRAWLRVPGMKAIPVTEDQKAAEAFWKALAKDDKVASAQAYIDGSFAQVPNDTICTVIGLSGDHAFAKVRVTKDGTPHDYWILATAASLDAPAGPAQR